MNPQESRIRMQKRGQSGSMAVNIFICIAICAGAVFFQLPKAVLNGAYRFQKKVICNKLFQGMEAVGTEKKEGKYSTIYYASAGEDYTNMMLEAVDTYYPLLTKEMGVEDTKGVTILLYPDTEMLETALGLPKGQAPMGAYYGGVLNILSPELWIKEENHGKLTDIFLTEGPMVHELTHQVVDEKLFGKYPLWFTEGVALYYEKKLMGFEWRKDLEEESQEITYFMLRDEFTMLNEALSYRKSYDIIENIVNSYGEKALSEMMDLMAKGKSFEKAIEQVSEGKWKAEAF